MSKILIIDDEECIAECLAKLLETEGHETLHTTEPLKGVERFVLDADFDMVIIDIHMPGVDGVSIATQLELSKLNCKLVFMTGMLNDPDSLYLQKAKLIGADAILFKPFGKKILIDCINSLS